MRLLRCLSLALLAVSLPAAVAAASDPLSYIAGAVQWTALGNTSLPALTVVQMNLDAMEPLVAQAARAGAGVVVFPEGALGMFDAEDAGNDKDAMFPFCAQLGDTGKFNPCESYGNNPPTPSSPQWQLWRASCLARKYRLIVSLDLCATRPCNSSSEPDCPSNGRWQWNTNTAWDEQGTLVLVYHKSHLFGEAGVLDQSAPHMAVFDAPALGARFASFICFDIMFAHPAVDDVTPVSAGGGGARDVLYPTFWVNAVPTYNALMAQAGWSRVHQVNVIAANTLTSDGRGGGIFASGEPLATHFNSSFDSNEQNVLLLAKLRSESPKVARADLQAKQVRVAPSAPVVSLSATELPSGPCIPNAVTFTPANCTLFSVGQLRKFAQAAGHDLDHTDVTFTLPQGEAGPLRCAASLTLRAGGAVDSDQYGLIYMDAVETYPLTPDPLHIQCCALQQCVQSPGLDEAVCAQVFSKFDTRVAGFTMELDGVDPTARVVPMLGLDDGQVGPTALADFHDSLPQLTGAEQPRLRAHRLSKAQSAAAPARQLTWSSTDNFNESLFSAAIMAVVPNAATEKRPRNAAVALA